MKKWIAAASLFAISTASFADYCAAIRGNGEGMPAHWGAMASVIEKKGMPKALAGGSSASLSIFLLESLSLNKLAQTNSQKALLVKSFQGYLETLTQTEEGKAIAALLADKKAFEALLGHAQNLDNLEMTPEMMMLMKKHLNSVQTLMDSADFKGLINPEFVLYVKQTIGMIDALKKGAAGITEGQVVYRKGQISKAINEFGKFNAETDETLFFRPGLISFSHLAHIIGQMADFYAGVTLKNEALQASVDQDMKTFIALCSHETAALSWREIYTKRPECRGLLGRAILTYRAGSKAEGAKGERLYQNIGSHLATFPTTSVLTGEAVERYREMKKAYLFNEKENFGDSFRVSQDELRFGYWGDQKSLSKIQKSLRQSKLTKDDEKSKKFLALGSQTWLNALSTSPAEPGLSNLVDMNESMISAGGWNDLHPTLVLKAYGCKDIVYVTRRGGESVFAQGVIKKLTNLEGFNWEEWAGLTSEERRSKNANGNSLDIGEDASLWSKLYNMANPSSSIRKSMTNATTIVCTDWDRFDARKDMNALIEDAFHSSWISDPNEICR